MKLKEKDGAQQALKISAEDLEAALRLLTDEEQATQAAAREGGATAAVFTCVTNFLMLVAFFALIPAVIVIWFDRWWGVALFLTSLVSGVLLLAAFMLPVSSKDFTSVKNRLRQEIGEGELAKAASQLLAKRQREANFWEWGCLPIALWPAALLALLVSLYLPSHALFLASLGLQGLSVLLASFWFTEEFYEDVKYYERVSKLRSRFETQLRQLDVGASGEVSISRREIELLGNIETNQAAREAAKTLEASGAEAESLYSIAFTREALAALEREQSVERRQRIRAAADALQFDPRPPGVAAAGDGFLVEGEDFFLRYEVNDEKERLVVTSVGAKEVTHAP